MHKVFKLDHSKTFRILTFFFISLWIICIAVILFRNLYGDYTFPKTSFLNAYVTRFGDFYGTYDHWIRLGWGKVDYGLSYFPAAYFVHSFFSFLLFTPQDAMKTLLVFAFISIYFLIRTKSGFPKKYAVTFYLFFCFTYPVVFTISTGNLELIFFIPFIYAFFELQKRPVRAAVFLGIAAAPKLVLLLFTLLFLNKRRPKDGLRLIFISICSSLLSNILAMLILPKGILSNGPNAIREIVQGTSSSIALYQDLMIYSRAGVHFGHSVLNSIHAFFGMEVLNQPIHIYSLSLILLLVNLITISKLIQIKAGNAVIGLALSITLCVSLPTSTDYRLIYVAFFFFLSVFESYIRKINQSLLWVIGQCLILSSLIPKPFFYLRDDPYLGMNVWFTPIALLLGLVVLLRNELHFYEKAKKERIER